MIKYQISLGWETNTETRVLENYINSCSKDVSVPK